MTRFVLGLLLIIGMPLLAWQFLFVPILGGVLVCLSVVTVLIGIFIVRGGHLPDN